MSNIEDNFENVAKTWDQNLKVVDSASSISSLIVNNINLSSSMHLIDFGAGTGLLSYFISNRVNKITAIDNSPAMLQEFKNKKDQFKCITEALELDITKNPIEDKFDGVISSMTIHHIEDIKALFTTFYNMLHNDGFIAIADLDSEDGTFHSDNTGVFHYGFSREELVNTAKSVGFRNIQIETAHTINKPHNTFTVFLLTAKK